jgi:hypothetical protein
MDLLLPFVEEGSIGSILANVATLGGGPDADPARLKRLFDRTGDPRTKGPAGIPLVLFAGGESAPVENVQLLLEHGAAVNAKTRDRFTALDYALRQGDTAVVGLLRNLARWKAASLVPGG